jgi:hypothetical protein
MSDKINRDPSYIFPRPNSKGLNQIRECQLSNVIDEDYVLSILLNRTELNFSLGSHKWSGELLDKYLGAFDYYQIQTLCHWQILDEDFIEKNSDKLSWTSISTGQRYLSVEFILRNEEKLHMDLLKQILYVPNYVI